MRITIATGALGHSITADEIRAVVEHPEHRVSLNARRPGARLILAIGAYDSNEPYIEVIYDVIARDEFEVFHAMMLRNSTVTRVADWAPPRPRPHSAQPTPPGPPTERGTMMSAKKIVRKPRLTDAEYADMAADYAAHPLTADDITGPIESTGTVMRMGRPTKTSGRGGKTPSTTVRLPQDIRDELARRAEQDGAPASEIVRRALVEHFNLHPAG